MNFDSTQPEQPQPKRSPIRTKLALWSLNVAATLALAVGALFFIYDSKQVLGAADIRRCALPVGDYLVVGERMYMYNYKEFWGYRFVDLSTMEESTAYILDGAPMTVVSVGETWRSDVHGLGEGGLRPLINADNYTFIVNDVVAVTTYDDFCE